jgi:hypothetical protein
VVTVSYAESPWNSIAMTADTNVSSNAKNAVKRSKPTWRETMTNDDNWLTRHGGVILIICLVIMVFVVSSQGGIKTGRIQMQKEVVKAGHAEYYLDENHERQWRWKEIPSETDQDS